LAETVVFCTDVNKDCSQLNKIEHKNRENGSKTNILLIGTTLANYRSMKSRITIKHITLAVGIIVALLAAAMFLVNDSLSLESRQIVSFPLFSIPKSAPALIQSAIEIIF
jgi:hypothetical protein